MENVNISIANIDKIIAEVRSAFARYKENKTYDKKSYDELLDKYSKLIEVVELLKNEFSQLKSKELPPKEQIESMSAILDLLNNFDPEKLNKWKDFSDKKKGE